MLIQVARTCADACGVAVKGEIDTATREFVHRFTLPPGADFLLRTRRTEVDGVRLVTFAPQLPQWAVDCPLCGKGIVVGRPD